MLMRRFHRQTKFFMLIITYLRTRMKRLQGPAVRRVVGKVARDARVEDLADGVGLVAVLLEVLRQRGEVAGDIAPVRVKVVEFRGVGSPGRKFCRSA